MKQDDLNLENWKQSDINTDSLWLINKRGKGDKHKNMYHGNFIPQIPNQLIRRYTKENDIIVEPFMGSGTALFECEKLKRRYIDFDINPVMFEYVNNAMGNGNYENNFYINYCISIDSTEVDRNIQNATEKLGVMSV